MLNSFKRNIYGYIGRRLLARHGDMVPDTPSPIEVPSRWIEPHKRARISYGLYEKNESKLVNLFLDSSIDTVELGSGVGVVSSHVCRKLLSSSRYIGLEGNPDLAEVAQRNVLRFSASADRSVEHAVVVGQYESGRKRKFHITTGNFHLSSIRDSDQQIVELDVPEISLSELLRRNAFNEFQLVSDVEGAEVEIFEDDPKSLDNCVRMIIELHDTVNRKGVKYSIDELAGLVIDLGFHQVATQGQVFVFEKTKLDCIECNQII